LSCYRKIYEEHHGSIPIDAHGRTYDIHHIDGNRSNNDISNLVALSIQDHYDTHWWQGDWAACQKIAIRMRLSPEEISKLASMANKKRVLLGTNPFVGPTLNAKMMQEGRHPWMGGHVSRRNALKLVEEGRHPFSSGEVQSKSNKKRIEDGTHNFLGGKIQRRQLIEGSHNFQKKLICPHCGYIGNAGNVTQHIKRVHNEI
jgi:hypothetical protein